MARAARLPIPAAIRAVAAVAVTAAVLLAVVIAVATSAAGSRMSATGGTDAPEVTAATGVYFSLNDMDAQVANALLAETDPALAAALIGLQVFLARRFQRLINPALAAKLRALAVTSPRAAAEFDTSMQPGQSNWAFYRYDQALSTVTGMNQRAFTAAVAAGEGDAAGWNGAVPAGGAALVSILVILGVRPRLAEYR